jgi:hypothetical protein
MGKQYKKLVKRRRRTAYLARRKAVLNEAKQSNSKKTKSTAKKATVRKKAAPAAKPEPVAEKAKTEDVLGPDVTPEVAESSTKESSPEEPKE